jgi:hypothetical protein
MELQCVAAAPLMLVPPQQCKLQVYLLFYKPGPDDPIQNRVVALLDGPFCHVEMAIPSRNGEAPWERAVWGSSIYQDEPVFFKEKRYQRDGYVSIALELSLQQVRQIRDFCHHHAQRRTPFHRFAMYLACLPVQVIHTDATFCSKHVTQALQSAGVLSHVNPALMTPSKLYRCFKKQAIVQVIPTRMQRLLPQPPPSRAMPTVLRLPGLGVAC